MRWQYSSFYITKQGRLSYSNSNYCIIFSHKSKTRGNTVGCIAITHKASVCGVEGTDYVALKNLPGQKGALGVMALLEV